MLVKKAILYKNLELKMADQADQIQLYVRAGAGPLSPLPSQGKPACLPVRVLHTTLLPT